MNLLYNAELCLIPEGQLIKHHAVKCHPQCPYIRCLATETLHISYINVICRLLLMLTIAALRSHEVVGALCLADLVVVLLLKELTHSEVTQLGLALAVYQDVLRFNVSVHDVVDVHYE